MRWFRPILLAICLALFSATVAFAADETPILIDTTKLITPSTMPSFPDLSSEHWAYKSIQYLAELGIVAGDEAGYFHPEDFVTRAQFIKMLVLSLGVLKDGAVSSFLDVPYDAWHYAYISSAFAGERTSGDFNPDFNITRQDMAFFASLVSSKSKVDLSPTTEKITFADEASIGDYAKTSVLKMQRAGIINGMADGSFAPQGNATRAQAAAIIYRLSMKN